MCRNYSNEWAAFFGFYLSNVHNCSTWISIQTGTKLVGIYETLNSLITPFALAKHGHAVCRDREEMGETRRQSSEFAGKTEIFGRSDLNDLKRGYELGQNGARSIPGIRENISTATI